MVIKVYVTSITGIQEVRGNCQHALFVMGNKCNSIDFKEIDIVDPINSEELEFYLANSKQNSKGQILPPQFFNEDEYCGVNMHDSILKTIIMCVIIHS